MCARENQHVALDDAHMLHHPIGTRANLAWRFPSRAAIAKQLPIRALVVDVSRKTTLVLPIVPSEQVPVDFSHSSEAGQLARSDGTLQRTGKHPSESQSPQPFRKPARMTI
jgi:hypothetical protein